MKHVFRHIDPLSFTAKAKGPHLLIIAGVHGDEYEPILAVRQLLDTFLGANGLISGKLTLLPIVNREAYTNGCRVATDGKDLARTCPGSQKGSITSQVAYEISELIKTADFLIDMHTGGKLFDILPLAGYLLNKNKEVLKVQRALAEVFGLPIIWGTTPNLNGRTLSIARDNDVPAIYTEFGGGGSCRAKIINSLVEGCMRVMNYLKLIDSPLGTHKEEGSPYILEDHRENSGHLQSMYPSPIDGVFISIKDLWEKVRKDEIIGRVIDPLTNDTKEIYAYEDGLLFLLRKSALVKKGETTMGIMPISTTKRKSIYT